MNTVTKEHKPLHGELHKHDQPKAEKPKVGILEELVLKDASELKVAIYDMQTKIAAVWAKYKWAANRAKKMTADGEQLKDDSPEAKAIAERDAELVPLREAYARMRQILKAKSQLPRA